MGELHPVHSLQRAVKKNNKRQQQRKQCNIVLPNKTSKKWHPINNNEWIFIFRAHNKTLFYSYHFFLTNVAEIRANPSQGPTTCQTLSNQIFASGNKFLFLCLIAQIWSPSSARVCSSKVSLCYLRISPSFSKMNAFFSALVLCLCFLAVSTAPEKNSAKSRMHDAKLSDKEHFDKDGKHNEEYDHEAFLGKEKKSFDQLTPEESKERLG